MTGKAVAFIVGGAALTGVLWVALKPTQSASRAPSTVVAAIPAPETRSTSPQDLTAQPVVRQEVFEFAVKDGRVVRGAARLQVHEGDQITLKIVSDRGDEVHLHGYDLRARVVPGEAATLAFTATRTGRFGLELHHAHIELGALEVYPN